MRVLYASFDEVPSFKGASTHILASLRRLLEVHELHLVTLGTIALPRAGGLHHHPQAIDEPNYLRRGIAFRERVAAIAARCAPELGHFRSPWEGIALLERGIPCVYEVNGLPSIELRQLYRDVPANALATIAAWERRCLEGARAVLCPSVRIVECLRATYGDRAADKAVVIPNGYDLPRAADVPAHAGPLRAVYLGTLHPWQGIFRILRCMTELRGVCTLDLYAPLNRSWEPLLQKRIARYGLSDIVRMHAPLHRLQLDALLPSYDVGLAPLLKTERNTVQGCHPIKLLDYLAHGLAVVAPDLFVARQAIRHEHNGLLYEADDLHAFVATLRRLAEDRPLLARLRQRARASLHGLPSWNEHSEQVREVYARIMSSGSSMLRDTPRALATR